MKNNMVISYLNLRKTVGVLGILLPVICVLLGLPELKQSISAYYYSNAIGIFIGTLCVAGAFMISYRGYDTKDDLVSAISGVSLILTALFANKGWTLYIHYPSAVIFFLSTAYMSYFQFSKGKHGAIYKSMGIAIFAVLIITSLVKFDYHILIGETIILWLFGSAWLLKGGK